MSPSNLRPARAFHDLNDVDTIEIIGWPGRYEVRPHAMGNPGVSIIAPRRIDGEFWTFAQQRDGVLKCHSDLIGDPHLLTDPGEPMVIALPANRIDGITVTMAEPVTKESAQ